MVTAAFMTAASPRIGGGHVVRCLALAQALNRRGVQCVFAINRQSADTVGLPGGEMLRIVEAEARDGLAALAEYRPDVAVFDGYGIDREIERQWRGRSLRVVFDDLADRPHECDLLVDSGPARTVKDYEAHVGTDCEVMAGPAYAVLRPAFPAARKRSLARRATGVVRRVFVSMGYTDVGGVTRRVVEGVFAASPEWQIDVVTGHGAESLSWLRQSAARERLSIHVDLDSTAMVELMVSADLAVGAGGGTALERCCLGLPSLMIVVAGNQRSAAQALDRGGAAQLLGDAADLSTSQIAESLAGFARQSERLVECSRAAAATVDGEGAERVSERIMARLAVQSPRMRT